MSLEEDEEIVYYLEKVDDKFSMIKGVLREIRAKIKIIGQTNRVLVENCKPWIDFFGIEKMELREDDDSIDGNSVRILEGKEPNNPFEVLDEQSNFTNGSLINDNKTPFSSSIIQLSKDRFSRYNLPDSSMDTIGQKQASENNMNFNGMLSDGNFGDRDFLKYFSSSSLIKPDNSIILDESIVRSDHNGNIDEESATREFKLEEVPEIFRKEECLSQIYRFIKKQGKVLLDDIYRNFKDILPEKIDILLNFLTRRMYIRRKFNQLLIDS